MRFETGRPASYDQCARNPRRPRRHRRSFSARKTTFRLRPTHIRNDNSSNASWRTIRRRSKSRARGGRRRRRRRFRCPTFAPCLTSTSISVGRRDKRNVIRTYVRAGANLYVGAALIPTVRLKFNALKGRDQT